MVYLGAGGNDPDLTEDATSEQKRRVSKTKARIMMKVSEDDAIDLAATFGLGNKKFDDFDKLIEAFDKYAPHKKTE
ncbi:hypothetical protein PR048_011061 [Dryococelus australis]|uniref:Uncharacterized protein n=1 Tax=Dryococelus australis TaxID=614101 RepID=A0ABQ9HKH8_9NEOP|nr:hypothetical protein PR048_011061 [Dryococelus australis]